MSPRVSCIVPVYNGARFLRQALDSVLAQTVAVDEIIVVDDGSTDASAALAESFGAPVRVVSGPHRGPAAARNRGIGIATGALLSFNDADDIWHSEKLARQLARFQARADLAVCAMHVQEFLDDPRCADGRRPVGPILPHFGPPALLIARSAFEVIGMYDESLLVGEDTDWMLRARDAGLAVEVLPEALLYRRLHTANLSRTHIHERNEALVHIFKTHLERVRQSRRDSPK